MVESHSRDHLSRGIVYVAYGDQARAEAQISLAALRQHSGLLAATLSAEPMLGARHLPFAEPGWGARWAKLNLDLLTPFEHTLYLDADTRPRTDPALVFDLLDDGFDLVIAESTMQGDKALWHVDQPERDDTLDCLGFTPLQLQAGVMAFRRNEAIHALFAAWREEWRGGQDQAALLRALNRVPVRIWVISHALSENLTGHLFGRLHESSHRL